MNLYLQSLLYYRSYPYDQTVATDLYDSRALAHNINSLFLTHTHTTHTTHTHTHHTARATLTRSLNRQTWFVDDIEVAKDVKNERLRVKLLGSQEEQELELSSMDAKGHNAAEFLHELVETIDVNKKLKAGDNCRIPVKYKRGFLTISVGKYERKTMWVQIGGLLLSYFEKPEVSFCFVFPYLRYLHFSIFSFLSQRV